MLRSRSFALLACLLAGPVLAAPPSEDPPRLTTHFETLAQDLEGWKRWFADAVRRAAGAPEGAQDAPLVLRDAPAKSPYLTGLEDVARRIEELVRRATATAPADPAYHADSR